MHFILIPGSIDRLDNLRADYEKERKVDLELNPSLFGMPTVFGGTDVKTRRRQIHLIESIKAVVNPFLTSEQDITDQQFKANLMASRIIIAACLYVQTEIGSSKENSALYRLINQYLEITPENYFDEEDKESCYLTAYELFSKADAFNYINSELRSLGKKKFTVEEWEDFTKFLANERKKKELPKPVPNNYPVTTLIEPIFQASFSYVGSTIGWVVAGAFNKSSVSLGAHIQFTGLVSSALLVVGPGTAGVALLAPTIAKKLLESFCTISLANISGTAFGYAGKGTAKVVGLPFDMTYRLLKATGTLMLNYVTSPPTYAPLDGIRLADGGIIVKGNLVQLTIVPKEINHAQHLQITEKGEIILENKSVEPPSGDMSQVIQELNKQFSHEKMVPESTKVEQEDDILQENNMVGITL